MACDHPSSRALRRAPLGAIALLALAWGVAALAFPTVTRAKEPGREPDLRGTWKLDKAMSDDPREAMQRALRGRREDFGGGRGLGPGLGTGQGAGGVRWRARGAGGSRGGPEGGRPSGADMGKRFDSLDIEPIEGGWSIQYADGTRREIVADDQERPIDSDVGKATLQAHWDGATLVVVRNSDRRRVTERFDVTDDGKLLQVATTIEGERTGRVEFRRLYRPAPSGE